jgi:hypothetical protein
MIGMQKQDHHVSHTGIDLSGKVMYDLSDKHKNHAAHGNFSRNENSSHTSKVLTDFYGINKDGRYKKLKGNLGAMLI